VIGCQKKESRERKKKRRKTGAFARGAKDRTVEEKKPN